MKKILLKWKDSIFRRLLSLFLFVMIPVYALAIYINYWGINSTRQEIMSSMTAQNSYYLSSLENELQRIKKMQFDCIGDDDLNGLAYTYPFMDNIEKTGAITRLQNRISIIKNSCKYIKRVTVYIPAIETAINSEGTLSGSISDIPQDEFNMLMESDNSSGAGMIYWNEGFYLSSVSSMSYKSNSEYPSFIIEIEMDKNEFTKNLIKSNIIGGSNAFLISPSNDDCIAKTTNNEVSDNDMKSMLATAKKNKNGTNTMNLNGQRHLIVFTNSEYLNMSLINFLPEKVAFQKIRKYSQLIILLSAVVLMIILFYAAFTYRLIHRPLFILVRSFKQVENGDFDIAIEHKHSDEFKYLYHRFNIMVENLKNLIEQVYQQKILMQKAELKQLQSQINPHFLYNSFYTIQKMVILEDNENAIRFTKQMGNYFKFITRSAADEVPLEKEVEHARVYTDIQAMRFAKRISVRFEDLPESAAKLVVPRLILQPILENAFEHGLKSKEKDGLLFIRFKQSETNVQIIVEDNGEDLTDEKLQKISESLNNHAAAAAPDDSEVTGMINIHRRIGLKFGQGSGLTASRGELGGLKVIMNINFNQ